MATRIEAIATISSHDGLLAKGGLALADRAAKEALVRAGRAPNEVDLLINAGIYHDKNLGEPALAAIIQEDIHANRDPDHAGGHGTFSFDVANGGAGFVTAAMLVDGFMRSHVIDLGLIVTSDGDPGRTQGFPFGRTGAAVVLSRSAGEGLSDFSIARFPEHRNVFESRVVWRDGHGLRSWLHGGENILEFHIAEDFTARAVGCAVEATSVYLDGRGLGVGDIDLLVPSPYPPGFATRLAERLGVPLDRVARPDDGRVPHTSGPLFALNAAIEDGRFAGAGRTLIVSVGAGLTVGLAQYVR